MHDKKDIINTDFGPLKFRKPKGKEIFGINARLSMGLYYTEEEMEKYKEKIGKIELK